MTKVYNLANYQQVLTFAFKISLKHYLSSLNFLCSSAYNYESFPKLLNINEPNIFAVKPCNNIYNTKSILESILKKNEFGDSYRIWNKISGILKLRLYK